MVKISHTMIEEILRTLPIGYYLGARTPVIYEKAGGSYCNLVDGTIHVSGETVIKALDKAGAEELKADELEEATRTILYHELSHVIMTPVALKPNKIRNCFEDERIETLLGKYYLGVNFKKAVFNVNDWSADWQPKDAFTYFYGIVRFRQGPEHFVKRVASIINRNAKLRADADSYSTEQYANEIERFWNDVQADWNANQEERKDEQEQRNEQRKQKQQEPGGAGDQKESEKQEGGDNSTPGKDGEDKQDKKDKSGAGKNKPEKGEDKKNGEDKNGAGQGEDDPEENEDEDGAGNGDGEDEEDADNEDGEGEGSGSDSDEESDKEDGADQGGNGGEAGDGDETEPEGDDADSDGEGEGQDGENADSQSGEGEQDAPEQEGDGDGDPGEGADGHGGKNPEDLQTGHNENKSDADEALERALEDSQDAVEEINRETIGRDFERMLKRLHNEAFGREVERMVIQHNKRQARKTPESMGYAGKVKPKSIVFRRDYKWFSRKGSDGDKRFGATHLTLWVDCSGSFWRDIGKVNSMICELNKVVRRMHGEFSFDVVAMTHTNELVKNNVELTAEGGNAFGVNVESFLPKLKKPGCANYNVAVWDGDMFSNLYGRKLEEVGMRMLRKIFDNPDSIIVTDTENREYVSNLKKCRVEIISKNYAEQFLGAVLKLLGRILV